MTREEAIKVLSSYDVNGVWADVDGKHYNAEEQAEAFDMAIEALQIDIVHCEECKHGIVETGSRFPFEGNVTCELDHVKRQWFKEDFCSYGERSKR